MVSKQKVVDIPPVPPMPKEPQWQVSREDCGPPQRPKTKMVSEDRPLTPYESKVFKNICLAIACILIGITLAIVLGEIAGKT